MKRFRRILLNTLTAISLLLALATAGLWVRNLFAADFLIICTDLQGQDLHYLELGSASGMVNVVGTSHGRSTKIANGAPLLPEHFGPTYVLVESGPAYSSIRKRVFGGFPEGPVDRGGYYRTPHWLMLALFGPLPAARLGIVVARLKRRRKGYCPACGYDIRANPMRCSECGNAIAARPLEPTAVNSPRASGESI